MQRFYADYTQRNQEDKAAVYLKGITEPMWVAINGTVAAEAVIRLNQVDSTGHLKGWSYQSPNAFGVPITKPGWTIEDLLNAAKGGVLPREAIKEAGTLLTAISVVANNKMRPGA